MLLPKIGGVPAHPANVHRLLFDEDQLVLVFPEGRKGTEKLYKDRYRLRRFGRGGFVEAAMRARAPIVPIAVVGAEEAAPIFAHVTVLQRLTGLLYFPITPTFPHFGLLGMLGYLPAKFKLRFLRAGAHRRRLGRRAVGGPGARPDRRRRDPRPDPGRALRDARPSGARLVRMSSKRILVTGLSTYWGGRLAQALERDPAVEAIIGVDRRAAEGRARAHRVRARRRPALAASGASCEAAEIDTVVDTRLVVDSIVTSPRLAHENNVIGHDEHPRGVRRRGQSPVRKVVFKSCAHYYGCEQDDPAFFTEEMDRPHPPRTPIERDIVDAERAVRDFARRHPHVTVTVLRFANGLGPALRDLAEPLLRRCPPCPAILGFDPRYQFIHEDDIVGCLEYAVRHDLRGRLQRRRRRRARAQRGRRPAGQAARAGAAAVGTSLAAGARCAAPASASRRRCSACCASGAGSTTASSRPPATATATRRARR